jgi:class 3 adenylate cyclase/predicted ATPase
VDVGDWLNSLGLGQYDAVFRESEIDPEVLPELTDADLEKLGVPLGHRKRLLKAISNLGSLGQSTRPPHPAPLLTQTDTAERRQLTVMFCDLVGSTALSAKLDPEDLHGVIGAYQRCCTELIERNGGFVAKYMGDGVLAYYGYPEAHEDDAERAVRGGLAVVAAAPKLVTAAGSPLHVRIGIATGLVVVGDLLGSGEAQERGVVGETPNLAARLQAMAEPDGVVIADGTRRLLGDLFELGDLGLKDLKGIAKSVRVWAALRESRVESRFEALHPSGLTALVGREEEYELLLRRWKRAKAGEGRVALLSGEPGIGKSRLIAAIEERVQEEPHIRLRHFCSLQHRDSALYPFISRIERAAGFEREDEAASRLDKLEAQLAKSGEVNAERAGLFAELLGLAPEGRYPAPPADPQRRREMTLAALLEELVTLSRLRPALLIFEDAQWADSTSLELLDRMVELAARLPVLAIVAFRPEFSAPWMGQAHVTSLSLNRLARRETAALVERVTGGKSLPPEILDRIVQHTDGVPLFIEELTKNLLEGGMLQEEAGGYALAIPSSLQDALMARLDRLSGAKQVAQTAAIIGREFSYELLRAVTSVSEDELCRALRQLAESELIFQRGDPPQARYTFKHALVQDTAYRSVLRANRSVQHRRVAEALEKQFPETVEKQPELLAYHYTEAGLAEPAIAYWRKAGQRAAKRAANVEAIDHLRRGLAMLEILPDRAAHADEELTLLLALGPALMSTRTTAAPEIQQVYDRALRLARDLGKMAELFATVWGSWMIALTRGNQELARACTAELFSVARKQKDAGYLLQAHHCAWPTELLAGNLSSAHEHVNAGLALYDKDAHRDHAVLYGGHDPAVCGYLTNALTLQAWGQPDRSVAHLDRGLALARELAHAPTLIHALWYAAETYFLRRDPVRVATLVAEWLPTVSESGSSLGVANATMMNGWAKVMVGDPEVGLAQLRNGLDRWRSTGSKTWGSIRLGRAAAAFIEAGDVGRGAALLTEAFQVMDSNGERWYEGELLRLQGEILMRSSSNRTVEAGACFERAVKVARSQRANLFELRAAVALSRLRCTSEQRKRRNALLGSIFGRFTEGFDTPDLEEARSLLDELTQGSGRGGPRRERARIRPPRNEAGGQHG